MVSTRRKQSKPAPKANLNSKKNISSPQTRQRKDAPTPTTKPTKQPKVIIGQRQVSVASETAQQKSLKDYFENFCKTVQLKPTKITSNEKSIERDNVINTKIDPPDRNSPSSISVEEMCVKMTLDEFHYNTNITELIKEYFSKQNHPEELLNKMLNNLDVYVERVYNRYIKKPKYRRDDLFKNLMILAEPINIDSPQDINSNVDVVDLQRNDKTSHRKRKRIPAPKGTASNSDVSYVQDDSSFEDDDFETVSPNKKRKVIKQVNGRTKQLTNKQTVESTRHNNKAPGREERFTTTNQENHNLQRCPSPQEGCSKWLYKLNPSDNSLQAVDPPHSYSPKQNAVRNCRNYVDNLSLEQMKEICQTMSLKEFKEETNIIEIIEEYFEVNSKSTSKSATVDNYVNRIYDRYVKKLHKRCDDLFKNLNLRVTDKAVELYKTNVGKSMNSIAQQIRDLAGQSDANITHANQNKNQLRKIKYVAELSSVEEESEKSAASKISFSKSAKQKESQSVADLLEQTRLFPGTLYTSESSKLHSQKPLEKNYATRIPCPHSQKRKYNVSLTESPNHIYENIESIIADKHIIDGNKKFMNETSQMIIANSINNQDSSTLTPIQKLIELNSQGKLMTKKPCPLSKKMKYMQQKQHNHLGNCVPNESRRAYVGIINETERPDLQQFNNNQEPSNSDTEKDRAFSPSKVILSTKNNFKAKNINNKLHDTSQSIANAVVGYATTQNDSCEVYKSFNHQNVNIRPRKNNCRFSKATTSAPEKQRLNENTAPASPLCSTSQETEPFDNQNTVNNTLLTNTTATTNTDSHLDNTTVVEKEHYPIPCTIENAENCESSQKTNSHSVHDDDLSKNVIKVEVNDISAYSDEVEYLPNTDETIVSIYDDLSDTEKMLNELFNPTDKRDISLPTPNNEHWLESAKNAECVTENENANSQISNAITLTSETDKADCCVIISSGSSSEVPPSPEAPVSSLIARNKLGEDTQCLPIEAVKKFSVIGCVQCPNLPDHMLNSYPKHGKNCKSKSKFTPLVFIPNYQFNSSTKPNVIKKISAQSSDDNDALEDLIEEDISQESIHHSHMNPVDSSLQTNSQLLNADLTYLTSASIPYQVKENINSAPLRSKKNDGHQVHKSNKSISKSVPKNNPQLVPTIKNIVRHNNYSCLSYLDVRSVVFGECVNRLNYESSIPFLEKIKDRQVRATIKVSFGRCQSLHIIGETLQILLGLNNKEWRCVMKLFEVIDRFEFQSKDPEPINKSLPYKILYYLFKTLPKFSQATLQSVTTGSADEVSCVRMSVEYFQPVRSLTQAFQPIILEKLRAYKTTLRTV